MVKCKICQGPTIALFSSFACKNECDLPEPEAKREERLARAVIRDAQAGSCPFRLGQLVHITGSTPRNRHCWGVVEVLDFATKTVTVRWLDGLLGLPEPWHNFQVPNGPLPP